MKIRSLTYFVLLSGILLVQSCGTRKNTIVHRGYHNLTARFNGYYWSNEAIKEGVYKIEGNNKDNYEKILPVYVVPNNENAKTTFPDFDKAIKKSSLVIQRHTIKTKQDVEIPTAGKWIDNNWINIGISRFYKREFFSGIEAFDYVARTYKTKDKYLALLWQAKALNEIGSVSQSDPIIGLLSNDKKLPKKIKSQLYALKGDYYIKRGLYKEAIIALTDAAEQPGILRKGLRKKDRARYAFIVGQLYEMQNDPKNARRFYEKAISLKPAYDMVFYANIKVARLVDTRRGNAAKTKQKLLKMTRDTKNAEYLDVIYYTLGEIEEKERNMDNAINYYAKAATNSVSNPNQKALAFLKLGEIYFDRSNYPLSESYYDSTVAVLPKDHPNYNSIVNRKTTLTTLIGYVKTIQREDSLQKLARMSESERNKIFDKEIERIEEEEERKQDQIDAIKNANQNPLSNSNNSPDVFNAGTGGSAWYFYTPTAVSFGVSDFAKKWGNRKNEDNWRRSQKGLTIDNITNDVAVSSGTNTTKSNNKKNTNDPRKTREYYSRQLPSNDSLMKASNNKIIEADYLLGLTYKEELNNNKRAIAALEDLNTRYEDHKYRLQTYYQLYRIYTAENNKEKAEYYKNKLIDKYPDSEYAKLIKNPRYAEEKNAQRSEVEKYYEETYDLYRDKKYSEVIANSNTAFNKYGKTDFSARFEFLKAMAIGYSKGPDSLVGAINEFLILYPNTELTPRANEILAAIKKQQSSGTNMGPNEANNNRAQSDTFKINLDAEHFVLIIAPDDPKIANPFKSAIDNFDQVYYSNKNFSIQSNLFATAQQMIVVKSFADAREAYAYLDNLKNDPKIYTGAIKKEAFTFLIISADNLPAFFRKANLNSYLGFYNEAYKAVIQPSK